MRLYADENFSLAVTMALRALGHDVLTALEDGRANQAIPDEQVLARATELERALLTLNRRDFRRLHSERPRHAGIVSCTYDPDSAGQASRINGELGRHDSLMKRWIAVNRPA